MIMKDYKIKRTCIHCGYTYVTKHSNLVDRDMYFDMDAIVVGEYTPCTNCTWMELVDTHRRELTYEEEAKYSLTVSLVRWLKSILKQIK